MFGDIPWNIWGHSPECLVILPGTWHSPHFPRSPHSVPRSCIPDFIHSQILIRNFILCIKKKDSLTSTFEIYENVYIFVFISSFGLCFCIKFLDVVRNQAPHTKKYPLELIKRASKIHKNGIRSKLALSFY